MPWPGRQAISRIRSGAHDKGFDCLQEARKGVGDGFLTWGWYYKEQPLPHPEFTVKNLLLSNHALTGYNKKRCSQSGNFSTRFFIQLYSSDRMRFIAIVREQRLTSAMKKNRPPTIVDEKVHRIILRCMQLVGRLPQPMTRKLGDLMGDACFWLDRKHRRITTDNLAFALGDELDVQQRWGLSREIFRNLGQILFEVGWFVSAIPDALNRRIRIDGLENIQEASNRGRGVLVITAHLGNWELLPVVGNHLPMPINVVYRPLDFMPLDLFFNQLRARFGAKLIPSRKAMLKIVRALKKKEAVVILMDQSVDWYDGVWVDFFGRRTATSIGVAMTAMKTGSSVVPVFLYREKSGFRVVFDRVIDPVVTGDKTRDIESNTLNFNRAIEKGIRRHPEQWFWVHRRWKNRPYCPWPRIVS